MKKKYNNLKSIWFYLLLLAGTAITIYSCKKDRNDASDTELPQLKVWYEGMIARNPSEFTGLQPLWNSVYINKQDKFTVYEIALNKSNALVLSTGKINVNERASKVNLRLLLFEDNVSKKIKYASYMYVEDDNGQNIKAIHYKSFGKLTGRVLYYHQNGQMANGWIYKDGKLTAGTGSITEKQYLFMRQNKLSAKPGAKLMAETRTECEGVLAETYFWGCTSVNNGDKTCSWHYKGTSYITVCHTVRDMASDLPQDEGDGGYVPPVNYDCKGDENGSAFYTEECGCIGGNTGITECPRDTTMQADFYKNAKANCVLTKLMENNFYKSTLNNFIGSNKPIDLTFKLENIPQQPGFITMGNTVPNPRTWSSTNIDVTLAANAIDSLPSISVALSLLHEGIHAEIYRKLLSIHGPSNLSAKNFPSLFNMWIKSREWEGLSHEFMANYYVNTIATALKEYDKNKFGTGYYQALAWGGLKGTEYYNDSTKVSAIKKNEIDSLSKIILKGRNKQNCNDL